jgi:hypothetical protein
LAPRQQFPASPAYRSVLAPFIAFTLAASALQVVSFGAEVVRTGTQIYESGSTVAHIELEKVAAISRALPKFSEMDLFSLV